MREVTINIEKLKKCENGKAFVKAIEVDNFKGECDLLDECNLILSVLCVVKKRELSVLETDVDKKKADNEFLSNIDYALKHFTGLYSAIVGSTSYGNRLNLKDNEPANSAELEDDSDSEEYKRLMDIQKKVDERRPSKKFIFRCNNYIERC